MAGGIDIHNAQSIDDAAAPLVSFDAFRQTIVDSLFDGAHLSALIARPAQGGSMQLLSVLARADEAVLSVLTCPIGKEYPSLTAICPQAHLFEREIFEAWGIRPLGHPWLKSVRYQPSQSGQSAPCGVADFFAMAGSQVHEVAVGPVHAGVIEPGHFRFQCHGEMVYHLEISLGYQHRGVQRAMLGGPNARTRHYMETLCGDTTIGHATAWCRETESLSATPVPLRAHTIRVVAAELERLANHIGDIGAIAGDVGYLPTMSYCGRIRGDALNMTALLCGNRFGRGLVNPGGVLADIDSATAAELLRRLDALEADTRGAIELMLDAPSVLARLEGVGAVSPAIASQIGMVGLPARACGLGLDVRHNFPYSIYRFSHIPVCTWAGGDCFARAYVRWMEIQHSMEFLREQLRNLPAGAVQQEARPLGQNKMVVAMTEGWRGQIVHIAQTDSQGRFTFYKVIDPSFYNWLGLAMAMRSQQISDFPVCNKSFNLSYCGHDL